MSIGASGDRTNDLMDSVEEHLSRRRYAPSAQMKIVESSGSSNGQSATRRAVSQRQLGTGWAAPE
jgi:hypothetical protein